MKIYEIEGRLRRLGLIDEEIGIIDTVNYLFVEEDKQDIEIVEYVEEALERGIVIWEGTAGRRITDLYRSQVTVRWDKMFEFVIEKAEDEVWIRAIIKRILEKQKMSLGGVV